MPNDAAVRCQVCGKTYNKQIYRWQCPFCGYREPKVDKPTGTGQ